MTDTLADILSAKRQHVVRQRNKITETELREQIKNAQAPRGFIHALENRLESNPYALIAEIKKASPSAGQIRDDFDPEDLAIAYANAGATCLSVVTDEPFFQGKDSYLVQARAESILPVLRKDFMLDPYQIVESRALGADCILLIMAALEDTQARELEHAAFELGMDVLAEVHSRKELDRALKNLSTSLIGINNRNLKTLKVDLATAESLAKHLPRNILGVCESGIRTHAHLKRMRKVGLSCFLVGEQLMREPDVAHATRILLGNAS